MKYKYPTFQKKTAVSLVLSLSLLQTGLASAQITEISDNNPGVENPVLIQDVSAGSNNLPNATTTIQQSVLDLNTTNDSPAPTSTPVINPVGQDETASSTPPLQELLTVLDEPTAAPDENTLAPLSLMTEEGTSTEPTGLKAESLPETDSATSTTASSTIDIEIINTNDIVVVNEASSTAVTGQNDLASDEDAEQTLIETGDINVYANVLNVVNTNLYNSKIVEMVENFNSLSADVLLNHPDISSAELAQDLVTKICTEANCQSLSSFTLTNNNTAAVGNDVSVSGDSGNNSVTAGDEVKNAAIRTGDVKAVVNVLNIVNTNLVNSRWTIATINVFGDWTGDLVLPSELYFQDYLTLGANTSQADLEDIKKVVINIDNNNQAEIINNVNTDAQTGGNEIAATGTQAVPDASAPALQPEQAGAGKKGDLEDSQIATGEARSESNVQNFVNTNIFNGKWYLGIVNTLGAWSGDIYSLPEQVAMAQSPSGLMFFSSSAQDQAALEMFEQTMAEVQNIEATVNIQNQNNAAIVNNVDILADTGNNAISSAETENAKIFTGNAYALANILNFANTNLVNSDLQVGLVNVFGRWNGNVVFGYPDLAVSQKLSSENFPRESGKTAAFEIDFSNLGQASMAGGKLQWQFDPLLISPLSISQNLPVDSSLPGIWTFDLGKISPTATGKIEVLAKTMSNLADGDKVSIYARIFGQGPERNNGNNESLLEVFAATTENGNGGNDSGNGGSGNNNPPGGGSGGQPASPLKIFKSNSANGQAIDPRSTVTFTLTIDNDSNNPIQNVIVYDTLRGPDGTVISEKVFPLKTMAGWEEVLIDYELYVPPSAAPGQYTNSAYAQGLDSQLRTVRSNITAISQFTVGGNGLGGQIENQNDNDSNYNNDNAVNSVLGVTENQASTTPQFAIAEIKGAKTVRKGGAAAVSAPSPLGAVAGVAEAAQPSEILVPFQQNPKASTRWAEVSKMFNLLLLVFLVAFGYATANLINRERKAQAQAQAAQMAETASPIIPLVAAKRRTRKPTAKKPPKVKE